MEAQVISSQDVAKFNTYLVSAFAAGWRFPSTGSGYGVECNDNYIQWWAMLVRETE